MIVIPMAGISRRFAEAGYKLPKYMLPLGKKTVFNRAVASFEKQFSNLPFLFILRDIENSYEFVKQECDALGIAHYKIILLETTTKGQAETVELGLLQSEANLNQPITIFNIDTFRNNFDFPSAGWFASSDGYLEVFHGSGANWSYVGTTQHTDEPLVIRTTEKQPISDLCCNGLYHFNNAGDFMGALEKERAAPTSPELYVAPLYNHLIKNGSKIHYSIVDQADMIFCGIPSEYEAELAQEYKSPHNTQNVAKSS